MKAWCSFPSICLRHWRAFPPYLVWAFCFFFFSASENACGLKLFKCSLLRTSFLIIYLLDLLSHIFSLKDKPKEKCKLSSSQRKLGDLKKFKKTLVLINNSHLIACTLVKKTQRYSWQWQFWKLTPSGKENDFSLKIWELKLQWDNGAVITFLKSVRVLLLKWKH